MPRKPKLSVHTKFSLTKTFFHSLENDNGLSSFQKGVREIGIFFNGARVQIKNDNEELVMMKGTTCFV